MDKPTHDIFCSNITWLRQHHNLTYRQMANIIHISVRSLKRMERGELPWTVDAESLLAIKYAFNVSAQDMFYVPLDK